jgi:hypothetical protein
MTNTNVTVKSDLKLVVVLLVDDKNLCHIRSVDIKVGGNIIHRKQDEIRVGKELYQLEVPEGADKEVHYQITIQGDDGGSTIYNYVYTPDGKKSIINHYQIVMLAEGF